MFAVAANESAYTACTCEDVCETLGITGDNVSCITTQHVPKVRVCTSNTSTLLHVILTARTMCAPHAVLASALSKRVRSCK
eukprot:4920-Heterococcus_DN1.PRE.2